MPEASGFIEPKRNAAGLPALGQNFETQWEGNENETLCSLAGIRSFDVDGFGAVAFDDIGCANWDWDLGANRSAGSPGLRATYLSWSWQPVDAGLLGVE
jgi:hypothetical protein